MQPSLRQQQQDIMFNHTGYSHIGLWKLPCVETKGKICSGV